jgi:hypothetical protein
MPLKALGQHFPRRRPDQGDTEVSDWLAEVMDVLDEIGAAGVPDRRPRPTGLTRPDSPNDPKVAQGE